MDSASLQSDHIIGDVTPVAPPEPLTPAARLLAKHPKHPLKAFWEALTDPSNVGYELPMAVLDSPNCGINKRTAVEDGPMTNCGHTIAYGATPLILAAHAGRPDVVLRLVQYGGVLKGQDTDTNSGFTPIHAAANCGCLQSVNALLFGSDESKADVRKASKAGHTPLHLAAANGHIKVMELLMEEGASPTATAEGNYSRTPLHMAASNNQAEAVKLLISRGVTVDAKDSRGETALHEAARSGAIESIIALMASHAKTDVNNHDGHTPWDLAIQGDMDQAAELLA
eukprot:GILI01033188.1.p1 GENE.GILI01033188.1~~GILI01033188.1.p1  ORF type:complete len:284 (+),score=57.02 GILI01033188.1:47-898(+)